MLFSGLFWAPFPEWKTLRSFALNVLRDEGMGKQILEPRIHEEVNRYCQHFIDPHLGEPISLSSLAMATCNIISILAFGGRSDYDDDGFKSMVDAFRKRVRGGHINGITKNIPLARFFKFSGSRSMSEAQNVYGPKINHWVERSKESQNLENPENIYDHFFMHQSRSANKANAFKGKISYYR